MKKSWQLSRRTVLRGIGAAVSLPLLEVMSLGSSEAQAQAPKRLAYLYFPNGAGEGSWDPEEVGPNGQLRKLNAWMRPLEPFKQDIILPRNLWTPRGNGHVAGAATWLTGGGFDRRRIDAGGVSADQLAARHFANQTLLPSLELSVRGEGFFSRDLPRNSMSWTDRNTPAVREIEPRTIFDRMFRTGENTNLDQSVLDLVRDQAKSLERRVSQADRRKVDEYLESVREIERRIEFANRQSRRAPERVQRALRRPPSGIPDDHQAYMRLMLDMVYLAFWADATRVCSFMLDHGQSNRYFNFIDGVRGTWHALSHWKDISGRTEDDDGRTSWTSRASKKAMYNKVTRWHHEQFAYFLNRLKQTPEGNANLLDNSMILYGSSLADGHEHSERNLPLVLAGKAGGSIQTGRVVRYQRATSMSNLHLSLLKKLGLNLQRFGDSSGVLTELG
ncbi:MAG: DUF1552 domain-containing protein [Gemmataceae bacterium]